MKPRSAAVVALYLALAGCVCGGALVANLMKPAGAASQPRAALAPGAAAHHGAPAAGIRSATAGHATTRGTAAGGQGPARMTASVATLPESGIVNEPSIAIDSAGEIFVTGPSGLQHSTSDSASPVWKSGDGGVTWSTPISTETKGLTPTGIGGADSDIVIGPGDSVYVASLWLGNTAMSVSTDHGNTFTELPLGHITPVDDRPWLYYDPGTSALYIAWDGAGALHVGKALLGAQVQGQAVPGSATPGQLVFEQDVPAVVNHTDRGCDACPPGTIVVDPSGAVHVAFAGPNGVGVASSTDGLTGWTESFVPGTANANVSNDFQVLRGDSEGNLYLLWTEVAASGDTVVYVSAKRSGSSDWQAPRRVSTPADALFGTLAVVSPGVVDVAYYGSSYAGDPNSAPDSTVWDLYLAQVQNLLGSASITTADVLPTVHRGNIATQGFTLTGTIPDRRLGDFFSIAVDADGLADIITAVDDGSGTKLQFVHEVPPPPPSPTPAPAFVLPPPPAAPAAGAMYPTYSRPSAAPDVAAATPDAATVVTGDAATAAAPSTGTTGRPSGPKYPDGVGVAEPGDAGGGQPGHGLPLWAYGLAGGGATAGRFLLRRGRG